MMYLVTPTQLLWSGIHISPEDIVKVGGNLEAIDDWQPASRPVYDSDVAVALRYGIPVKAGIVVDAIYILDQERPRELREANARARQASSHPQIQATEEYIDRYMIPGWQQQGEDLWRKIDESSARSVREAEEDARRQLEVPIKPELQAHWRTLNGPLPR